MKKSQKLFPCVNCGKMVEKGLAGAHTCTGTKPTTPPRTRKAWELPKNAFDPLAHDVNKFETSCQLERELEAAIYARDDWRGDALKYQKEKHSLIGQSNKLFDELEAAKFKIDKLESQLKEMAIDLEECKHQNGISDRETKLDGKLVESKEHLALLQKELRDSRDIVREWQHHIDRVAKILECMGITDDVEKAAKDLKQGFEEAQKCLLRLANEDLKREPMQRLHGGLWWRNATGDKSIG